MPDDKLPPELEWEPDKLTLAQMLRRDLFPRWEWIVRANPDPVERENQMLSRMLLTGQLPDMNLPEAPAKKEGGTDSDQSGM
ncbi:hypothetical protein [Effusibacillus lacus]|uniref:Uncharacterized protein n=1 Tax=Effusibacillus lacus TaxID=1348429 RepID=A0A292YHK3_9BACL|nr:hypothetical protein [Effusibacillus lacus]TCS72866.1 hypothetical protein EDD64_12082 [Effusibacillus lacus]GAX89208.1 hypothetical protein EFBL_0826 [Effusibacillus lacus]